MQMIHWVYIMEDEQYCWRIGISANIDKVLSEIKTDECVVYLHPFASPFDGVAHKHLLDDLSKSTLRYLIRKQKVETERLHQAITRLIKK
ncbi:MAG: hypothetical protein BGO34_03690 [Bacteroidia bacterium 44-10]|nr:MAG: hypothetical protein BGO34_03690 [Bacteroidia bacterium 44-10]